MESMNSIARRLLDSASVVLNIDGYWLYYRGEPNFLGQRYQEAKDNLYVVIDSILEDKMYENYVEDLIGDKHL